MAQFGLCLSHHPSGVFKKLRVKVLLVQVVSPDGEDLAGQSGRILAPGIASTLVRGSV